MKYIVNFIRENKVIFDKSLELDKLDLLLCELKESILEQNLEESLLLYTYCDNQLAYCRFQMIPNLDNKLRLLEDSLVWLDTYTEYYFKETDKSLLHLFLDFNLGEYLWNNGDLATKKFIQEIVEGLENA